MDRCGFVVQKSYGISQSRKGPACFVDHRQGMKAGAYRIHTIGQSVSQFLGSPWGGGSEILRGPANHFAAIVDFLEFDRYLAGDTTFLHGDAVDHVGNGHRLLAVGDDDEFRGI